ASESVAPPLSGQTPPVPPVEEALVPPEPAPVEEAEPSSETTPDTPPLVAPVAVDLPESVPLPEPETVGETGEDTPHPPEPPPEEEAEPRLPPTKSDAAPQPRRYQPQARGTAPRKRNTGAPAARQEPTERSCPIEVRLRNRVGGAFTLSLLP